MSPLKVLLILLAMPTGIGLLMIQVKMLKNVNLMSIKQFYARIAMLELESLR